MRGQVQTHDIRPCGHRFEASHVDIFLGVVGDEMVVKTIYFHGDCLTRGLDSCRENMTYVMTDLFHQSRYFESTVGHDTSGHGRAIESSLLSPCTRETRPIIVSWYPLLEAVNFFQTTNFLIHLPIYLGIETWRPDSAVRPTPYPRLFNTKNKDGPTDNLLLALRIVQTSNDARNYA